MGARALKSGLTAVWLAATAASGDIVVTTVPDNFIDTDILLFGRSGAYLWKPTQDTSYYDLYSMDLDGNGTEDFRFRAVPSGIRLECAAGSAAWALPPRPDALDNISWLFPLNKGDSVGPTVLGYSEDFGEWRNEDVYVSGYFQHLLLPPFPFPEPVGLYRNGTTAYAGLRFEIDGATHYGRVLIDEIDPNPLNPYSPTQPIGAAFVVQFAYEMEPDTPIQIPEPSTVGLLGGAALILLLRRRLGRLF